MEDGIHELTAGYALDALDPEERSAYEEHLAGCERCRQELASFWQTTEALAIGASGPAPSPALRERILADVRVEPQVVVPFAPRRRRLVPIFAAAAAVAAIIVVAMGVWTSSLSSQLDDARSALDRERASAAVLADPDARTVALKSGAGRLVVDADGRAVLVLDGLEPAPSGKTYEMWIIAGETPARAGIFPGRDGRNVVGVDGLVRDGDVVAVTVEPGGGVDAPTSSPIVATDPV